MIMMSPQEHDNVKKAAYVQCFNHWAYCKTFTHRGNNKDL